MAVITPPDAVSASGREMGGSTMLAALISLVIIDIFWWLRR